jgi:aryl-alcohol dehydrogenase-like predicted oxidoreductase
MGIVVRGGVARGAPDDWDGRRYYMVSADTMRDIWEQARLDELLDGMTRTAFMLRFTLSHPDLDTTIVGTSSVEHLRDNLTAAAEGPLPDDVMNEARNRLDGAGARPSPA